MNDEDSLNNPRQNDSNSPIKNLAKINKFSKVNQSSKQGISLSNSNKSLLNSFRKTSKNSRMYIII